MHAHPDLQHPVQLDAGESLFFRTKAGSSLISTSGSLVVTGTPLWLGEQVFRARIPLEPGLVHAIAEGGWITLTAGPNGGTARLAHPQVRPGFMAVLRHAGKRLLAIASAARTGPAVESANL